MKRSLFLIIVFVLSLAFINGCHKDPLDLGNVGFLRLELKKGYNTQNKGAVDSFYATVKIVYGEEEVAYNCQFSDPNDSGFYTNDISSDGDIIYVRKDMEFRVIIEAEIDGFLVTGESATMMYSDDMEMLSVEIVLRAGSSRIAIYKPREDEIFGNYVVAYGEILENVGTMPIREAGVMLVRKSVYDTYQSADSFTFDNEQGNSNDWTVEYYYAGHDNEESDAEISKFSVVMRGLEQNTAYCMRAFAFTESDSSMNWCYSRVVEFSTNNNVAHDISVVTNDADNVSMDGVDVAGRVVLLDGNSPDSVTEMGFAFDTYSNYVANSSKLDYYRNNSFIYPASEVTPSDNNIIVFSSNVTGLQEGETYVFRAYATFREQPYYGAVRMFAIPQNPENIRLQSEQISETLTSAYIDLQGSIINDAGYEFSEVGFVYGFYGRGEAPSSVYDLNGRSMGSQMSGRFSSRVNLPIVEKTMYYAAYALTTTGYEAYGELSEAVSVVPENVPSISSLQLDESATTTHSMTISCFVDANGRSDCECGIIYSVVGDNNPTYDTVKKYSSSSGTEEFVLNNLRKGTNYRYWAYIRVVDEYINTEELTAETLDVGSTGPGGGIIFYADDENGFALEYYYMGQGPDQEMGDSAIWGSTSGLALNTDAPSSITVSGRTNTEAIISYHNGIGFSEEYAAQKCYQSTQGGKNDWYLPTSVEMQELLNYTSTGEGLESEYGFWTSDEQDAGNAIAFTVSYDTGSSFSRQSTPKTALLNYVLVRRF